MSAQPEPACCVCLVEAEAVPKLCPREGSGNEVRPHFSPHPNTQLLKRCTARQAHAPMGGARALRAGRMPGIPPRSARPMGARRHGGLGARCVDTRVRSLLEVGRPGRTPLDAGPVRAPPPLLRPPPRTQRGVS